MAFSTTYIDKPIHEDVIKVHDWEELFSTVHHEIDRLGWDCSLNHIDVSEIEIFDGIFKDSKFNGDISQWDVSHGISFNEMFKKSEFNSSLLNWDMSSARNLRQMFFGSKFNQEINIWNVRNVETMEAMFSDSDFDQELDMWDVSNVLDMREMFQYSCFTKIYSLEKWKVNNCNISHMFDGNELFDPLPDWYIKKLSAMDSWTQYASIINYATNKYHNFTIDRLKKLDPGKYTVYLNLETGEVTGNYNGLFYDKVIPAFSFEIKENMQDIDYQVLLREIREKEKEQFACSYKSSLYDVYPSYFLSHMPVWITKPNPYDKNNEKPSTVSLFLLQSLNYHAKKAGLPEIIKLGNRLFKYKK